MRVDHLRAKVVSLVAFVGVCLLLFVYLFQQAGGRIRVNEPYKASALVPESLNIVNNSDVRRDGITIGRVRGIEPAGSDSRVTFEIEKEEQAQLYRDATIRVRTKTLVGESYIDVEPGTPSAGKLTSGATIPLAAAKEVVPLERILSAMDPATRREVRRNLDGLGDGLNAHGGDLNQLFGALKPTVTDTGNLVRVLEPQRRELAALIGNTGVVMQALGERTTAFRSLVADANSTADAVVARDDRLRESLSELPATLDRAQSSVRTLADFSGRATPVLRSLKLSARQLTPAVRDLEPVARNTRTLFKELTPFLKGIDPLLSELTPAASQLRKLVPALDAVTRQLNPTANYLKSYAKEFGTFFANVGSLAESKDAYGYKDRVFAMVGTNNLTNLTPTEEKVLQAIIGINHQDMALITRRNAYPEPGTAGDPKSPDGSYTRVEPQK
ncbi:MAG: hypothetical protein JWN65_1476 [Solirubrobacterales bacterium]|nr:hypothetical protein [Solirubrobacterales bacterium]